ncbi:MAG: rhodanese-related sulfurtransferase [Candidatus Pelagisphaera sp.]|jgi:rhodanese-related sulfurtransferase
MFWIRVKQITAKDAKALVEEEGGTMIDVRRTEDYEKSHVDGAISADKNKVHESEMIPSPNLHSLLGGANEGRLGSIDAFRFDSEC